MNASELRPLVLEILRSSSVRSFGGVNEELRRRVSDYSKDDEFILHEILWELLTQRVIAPGYDSANLTLPSFHVTGHGRECLASGKYLPHDPDGYLIRLRSSIGTGLDAVVITYVAESLGTFLVGHYFASTVMLGVASERCVDILLSQYAAAISDPGKQQRFRKKVERAGRGVKKRFDCLRTELMALTLPPDLSDALDISLSSVFTLIRRSRNDAGHPTGRVITADEAHGNLLLFPQYCQRVHELVQHFRTHSV